MSVPVYEAGEEAEGLPFDGNKLTLPGYVLVQPSATLTIDLVLSVDDDRTHDREYRALPVRFEGGRGKAERLIPSGWNFPIPSFPIRWRL